MDSFFGIGLPELILILIVAGIVMGPERIGQTARWLGRTTTQLQRISRGFVRQLNQELDSAGDGQAIKDTMQELKQLRKELTDLRGEVTQTASSATRAGQQAFDEINNSIKPPSLNVKPPTLSTAPVSEVTPNGQAKAAENEKESTASTAVPPLPKLLDIQDDPE
jgi:Sec-independent protein translocase protein TatA